MNGHVDEKLRALVPIRVAAADDVEFCEISAWVDTAFNGSLVVPRSTVERLNLIMESSAEAILADGTKVELETFGCQIEWFGAKYHTQVVLNDSEYALLGTMLLAGRRLEIDYGTGHVSIQ